MPIELFIAKLELKLQKEESYKNAIYIQLKHIVEFSNLNREFKGYENYSSRYLNSIRRCHAPYIRFVPKFNWIGLMLELLTNNKRTKNKIQQL